MSRKQTFIILTVILGLALALRLWGLSRGDMLSDEVLYAFRAIGLLDYFNEPAQTTPLEWFNPNIPWWTRFSFHDHPPFVFLIQHAFIWVLGESAVGFRLPSAIFGVLSVYLVYLLSSRFFSKETGLISAVLLAVTLNHVFISRVGLQEVYVIFWMLLAIFLFIKALKGDTYFIYLGLALGLALSTKYITFILVPIFLTYILFTKREVFLKKYFWAGGVLAMLIFAPVIIYNIGLYQTVGHFDFQFSYIFGQNPEVWRIAPGKELGTLYGRINNFVPNLIAGNSWIFLTLFFSSVAAFFVSFFRSIQNTVQRYGFFIIIFFWLLLLIMLIGPSPRFLTLLTPFMAISIGALLSAARQRFLAWQPVIGLSLFGIFIAFEIFYSFNNQITYYPSGSEPWLASKIRYENYNIGYNGLSEFLTNELEGKMPGVVFDAKYTFLARLQNQAIERYRKESRMPYNALIAYYGNFDQGPRLWTLDRLLVYHGWPIIDFDAYSEIIKQNGPDFFTKAGVNHLYFIERTNIVPSPEFHSAVSNTRPIHIYNKKGDAVFRIYKQGPRTET